METKDAAVVAIETFEEYSNTLLKEKQQLVYALKTKMTSILNELSVSDQKIVEQLSTFDPLLDLSKLVDTARNDLEDSVGRHLMMLQKQNENRKLAQKLADDEVAEAKSALQAQDALDQKKLAEFRLRCQQEEEALSVLRIENEIKEESLAIAKRRESRVKIIDKEIAALRREMIEKEKTLNGQRKIIATQNLSREFKNCRENSIAELERQFQERERAFESELVSDIAKQIADRSAALAVDNQAKLADRVKLLEAEFSQKRIEKVAAITADLSDKKKKLADDLEVEIEHLSGKLSAALEKDVAEQRAILLKSELDSYENHRRNSIAELERTFSESTATEMQRLKDRAKVRSYQWIARISRKKMVEKNRLTRKFAEDIGRFRNETLASEVRKFECSQKKEQENLRVEHETLLLEKKSAIESEVKKELSVKNERVIAHERMQLKKKLFEEMAEYRDLMTVQLADENKSFLQSQQVLLDAEIALSREAQIKDLDATLLQQSKKDQERILVALDKKRSDRHAALIVELNRSSKIMNLQIEKDCKQLHQSLQSELENELKVKKERGIHELKIETEKIKEKLFEQERADFEKYRKAQARSQELELQKRKEQHLAQEQLQSDLRMENMRIEEAARANLDLASRIEREEQESQERTKERTRQEREKINALMAVHKEKADAEAFRRIEAKIQNEKMESNERFELAKLAIDSEMIHYQNQLLESETLELEKAKGEFIAEEEQASFGRLQILKQKADAASVARMEHGKDLLLVEINGLRVDCIKKEQEEIKRFEKHLRTVECEQLAATSMQMTENEHEESHSRMLKSKAVATQVSKKRLERQIIEEQRKAEIRLEKAIEAEERQLIATREELEKESQIILDSQINKMEAISAAVLCERKNHFAVALSAAKEQVHLQRSSHITMLLEQSKTNAMNLESELKKKFQADISEFKRLEEIAVSEKIAALNSLENEKSAELRTKLMRQKDRQLLEIREKIEGLMEAARNSLNDRLSLNAGILDREHSVGLIDEIREEFAKDWKLFEMEVVSRLLPQQKDADVQLLMIVEVLPPKIVRKHLMRNRVSSAGLLERAETSLKEKLMSTLNIDDLHLLLKIKNPDVPSSSDKKNPDKFQDLLIHRLREELQESVVGGRK